MSVFHLYILTGSSRGMGLAMAVQLLQPGQHLLCIARQPSTTLQAPPGALLEQWPLDLAQGAQAAQKLHAWLQGLAPARYASATLINNAGVIPRIAPLADCAASDDLNDIANALRVGLEAPMLLSAAFLAATEGWGLPRKLLNISSGLGRRPMAAQAPYCAAKAGLDHFSRCLALEEAAKPHGARVCALAPGVIDTDMQLQLRSASAADFPDQERFAALHHSGELTDSTSAAARVLAWLARPDFGQAAVADVRTP